VTAPPAPAPRDEWADIRAWLGAPPEWDDDEWPEPEEARPVTDLPDISDYQAAE
jgi:hypothetical protein